ncbi:TPA: hypothetical protein HA241_07770 [Candidatus Woesearchaeota archaeon]|nr:hypothetical protein [Candidatus Woesearchaeota archaeon]
MPRMSAEQRIIVEYDGNYADQMDWQADKLARFAGLGDLRTQVYIRRGLAHPQASYTELTNVLAWRRILDPASIFSPGNHEEHDQRKDIRSNLATASSVVFINDQILIQNNKDRNKGDVNEREYVSEVSNLVNSGLRETLNIEKFKQHQWAFSFAQYAWNFLRNDRWRYTAAVAAFPLGLYSLITGVGHFLENLRRGQPEYLHISALVIAGVFGTGVGTWRGRELVKFYEILAMKILELYPELAPYQLTPVDFNPLKHTANLILGNAYLSTWGRRLIEYKP